MPMARGWSRPCVTTRAASPLSRRRDVRRDGACLCRSKAVAHPNLRWFRRGCRISQNHRALQPPSDSRRSCGARENLNDAFDAADAPVLELADMAGFPPELWNTLRFQPHPSAFRLNVSTKCRGDLAGAEERRDAARRGCAGGARPSRDLAAGCDADVPRACPPTRR